MPIELQPYRSPLTPTIANLIGGADQARAEGLRQSGAAIAQGVEHVGAIAGATANNLVRLKLDEPRRQFEQLQLSEAQRANADDLAARDAFTKAQGDPDKAIALLESTGNYLVSMKLRSELNQQRLRDIETQGHLLDNTEKRLGQVTQLMQAVETDPDPPTAYKRVVHAARQYAGPQLAASIPDEYDPAAVAQLKSWGMKSVDYARQRRDAATTAASALRSAVTRLELSERMTEALALAAQTVESPEEWAQEREGMTHVSGDVAKDVLAKFPEQWSPDLKTVAAKYLPKTGLAKTETVTYTGADGKSHITEAAWNKDTNQWFAAGDTTTPLESVRKFQRDPEGRINPTELADALMKDPAYYHKLTDSAITQVVPILSKRGFVIPDPNDRGASLATAERFRFNALRALERDYAAARQITQDGQTPMAGQMTQAEYEQKKTDIQKSYELQLHGRQPAAPAAPNAPAAPVVAPKPAAAPPAKPAAPKAPAKTKPTGPITVTIQGYGTVTFPNVAARDAFMKKAGLSLVNP